MYGGASSIIFTIEWKCKNDKRLPYYSFYTSNCKKSVFNVMETCCNNLALLIDPNDEFDGISFLWFNDMESAILKLRFNGQWSTIGVSQLPHGDVRNRLVSYLNYLYCMDG